MSASDPQHTLDVARMTTAQKTVRIRSVVQQAGDDWRRRLPWLKRNDLLATIILFGSLAGMAFSAWLYLQGDIAWWVCVPVVAIFASFTHELEHDLIHQMYFRKNAFMLNLYMALVWLARPSTINPWIRRHMHMNHHKYSGQPNDIEERGITNGVPWGIQRLLMLGDAPWSVFLRLVKLHDWHARGRLLRRALVSYFPLGWLNWATWWSFVGFHAADGFFAAAGHPLHWSTQTLAIMHIVDAITVVIVAPNVLRSFCLHTVSSNMHYYGDVEDGNVLQQTQVLNVWWLWPLQLFCFNFGSTHAIHHFVVKEPFYIRQLTAGPAHRVMREMGVRFNDLGTFQRANRYQRAAATLGNTGLQPG